MKFVPKELKETADISRGTVTWVSALKNVASVVLVLALLYLGLGLTADLLASLIPEELESSFMVWDVETPDAEDPEFQRAQAIFDRLLEQPGLRPLPYRLFLLNFSEPNAVAVPGGGVGVSPALLKLVTSETGLALVLSHELGHHQGRHTLKRLGRALLYRGTMALLFAGSGSSVVNMSLKAAHSSYSRGQEQEADEFGIRLVNRVYGHTRGALEFFEDMAAEQNGSVGRWASFLASHPFTEDRIADLQQLQEQLNPGARAPR
ncbi:MAG: M48 family metallopeptidase [Planctomycetota bacterium]